jgi:predicted site-specific integrase-resolvase
MSIEKHLSLRAAARRAGIDGKTLKDWMRLDLGICFPRVRHGAKLLVRERDVEFVLAKRRDARNPRRLERAG